MRIKFVGFGTRIVAQYTWDDSNGHVVDVDDVQIAANLLTYPRPEFELADDEPQLKTLTRDEIVAALIEQAMNGSGPERPAKARRKNMKRIEEVRR